MKNFFFSCANISFFALGHWAKIETQVTVKQWLLSKRVSLNSSQNLNPRCCTNIPLIIDQLSQIRNKLSLPLLYALTKRHLTQIKTIHHPLHQLTNPYAIKKGECVRLDIYKPTNHPFSNRSRTRKYWYCCSILHPDWSKCPYFCLPPKVESANQAFRPIRAQNQSVKK